MTRKTSVNEHFRRRSLRRRTSEKPSQMKRHNRQWQTSGTRNRHQRASFLRWTRSFIIDHTKAFPNYFTAIFVAGPKVMPVAGKRLRLNLDYMLYLRDEGYQIPNDITDEDTKSVIHCRVDLVKPLPGQTDIPPKQRRVQIVVSYDISQLELIIVNTPDLAFDLEAIGNELSSYTYSGRMQILYDPNGLTSKYQGVVLQSLGTITYGGRTAAAYTPPFCHINNNMTYEDSNSKKLQISFIASSGPNLDELGNCAKKLAEKEPVFVNYCFKRYAYDQNGQIQPDFAKSNQIFMVTIKLIQVNFSEATANCEKTDDSTEQTAQIIIDKTSCTVSGIIHQISTLNGNQSTKSYKISPAETDEKIFSLFSFIKIQHWQAKNDFSTNPSAITERNHTTPPYICWSTECPERAAICHVIDKDGATPNVNTSKLGIFPYVPIPCAAWTRQQTKPARPRTEKAHFI